MNTPSATLERPPAVQGALRAILAGGLIAGTIDIFAASLINWINPLVSLRFVAGGLLGKAALQGGLPVSALGMLLQWLMSLLIASIFVIAAVRLRWLTARPLASGLAYGVVTYFVMNYVVVPLSAWHHMPTFKLLPFVENLVAMLVFGLIIAWCARRELRRQ
jgi:hypothetical protein